MDLRTNQDLVRIRCEKNSIEKLDISSNLKVAYIDCSDNKLQSLNLANGNNTKMQKVKCQGNPDLTCIQHDKNFDPTTNTKWEKDDTATYSTNCGN